MTRKGVWNLQQVRDKYLQSLWNNDGQLWAWGYGGNGNLGVNSRTDMSSPVQVPGGWSRLGQTKSDGPNAAVKDDGTLWMMGLNSSGQSGTNDRTNYSSPVQVPGTNWSNYVVTSTRSFATKTDGTLWVMGDNFAGSLGQNNQTKYSSPTQIPGTDWDTGDFKIGITNVSGYAIKTNGELWSWGYNQFGELAQNNNTPRSSPIQIPGTTWRHVSGSSNGGVMATKTDGTLWAWGANQNGQLGLNEAGTTARKSSPVQIPGSTWYAPFMMSSAGAAVKTDGTLWAWGMGTPGHLGQNNTTQYSSPVQVPGTTWDIDKVRFGAGVLGGLKTDGTLWLMGRNDYGPLGQNNRTNYSSPIQVPGTYSDVGGFGWYSISALRNPLTPSQL